MRQSRVRLSARARLSAVGVIALVLFFVLYAFSNLTVAGQSLENGWAWTYDPFVTVGYWLRQHDLPPLSFDRATIVVGTLLAVVIAAVRRHWRTAVWVAVATPGAVLASEGFKTVFDRPLLVESRDTAVSYPSGHAVAVLAVAGALLIVVPRSWARWVAPVVGVWMALATSAITVIGNHRPSEIVGAALLTIAVFTLSGILAQRGLADDAASSAAYGAEAPKVFESSWMVPGVVTLVVVAGVVAAWGAPPWVTAIDGVVAATASLLILRIVFVMRSWITPDGHATVERETEARLVN